MYNKQSLLYYNEKAFVTKSVWIVVKQIHCTLREESSQANVILQYKLLASILSAMCSVIQQS